MSTKQQAELALHQSECLHSLCFTRLPLARQPGSRAGRTCACRDATLSGVSPLPFLAIFSSSGMACSSSVALVLRSSAFSAAFRARFFSAAISSARCRGGACAAAGVRRQPASRQGGPGSHVGNGVPVRTFTARSTSCTTARHANMHHLQSLGTEHMHHCQSLTRQARQPATARAAAECAAPALPAAHS